MLEQFRVARYTFTLTARQPLLLPAYKGSTLRGVFGHAFKHIVCARQGQECADCLLHQDCPYALVFESRLPDGVDIKRLQAAIPRPFVIEPPLGEQTRFAPGDELTFGLVLIGRAIDLLAYFVVAFQEAGKMGIGQGRGQYVLARVQTAPWQARPQQTVYTQEHPSQIIKRDCALSFLDLDQSRPGAALTLDFVTPTRIKDRGRWLSEPQFPALVRALLQRVSALSRFYCDQVWEHDYRGAIDRAGQVKQVVNATWGDWERYSTRQDRRVKMGGFVGRARYEGELDEFVPLLLLGSLVHVGKGAVFGNGRYVVDNDLLL